MNGHIPVDLTLDGQAVDLQTSYSASGAGAGLTLSSAVAAGGEALELISTYLSHPAVPTAIQHLFLAGALGATLDSAQQPYEEMNTLDRRRACCYEHLQALGDELRRRGHDARVFVDDRSFEALEGALNA